MGPGVFLGKRAPPVAFHIAHGILKYIGNAIDLDFSVYTVMHTVNAVPALHEWNILKRSHNVILDGRKSTEVNRSCNMEFGSMDIQRETRLAESENAMLIYSIDGNFSGSAYPTAEEVMTREQLESVAEIFDYSIQPQAPDRATVEQQLEEAQAAYDAAHTYVPETYGSFDDCLKADILLYDDALQYTFYDITGDGEEELLVGKNGAFDKWLTIQNGEVMTEFYGETYVCEGGILENYGAYEIFEEHTYLTPNIPGEADTAWNSIICLQRTRDQWTCTDYADPNASRELTPEEAQAIMAKYPRVELKWMPLMDKKTPGISARRGPEKCFFGHWPRIGP